MKLQVKVTSTWYAARSELKAGEVLLIVVRHVALEPAVHVVHAGMWSWFGSVRVTLGNDGGLPDTVFLA
jgi:hypothetical protein